MQELTAPMLLLGGATDAADVRYATGFTAPDPFLFLDDGAHQILLVTLLEYGRAVECAPHCRVLLAKDLPISKTEQHRLSGCAYGLLKLAGRRAVRVSAMFPIAIVRRLEKKGIRVLVLKGGTYPQRVIKSEKEIAEIARSQRAAAAAIQAAAQHLRRCTMDRAGYVRYRGRKLTSEDLRVVIEIELLRHNGNPGDTIVASGPASANPHERGHGPIRAGTPIILDVFPSNRYSGYFGDITRTLVKGRAPDALRRMMQAVHDAQQLALQTVRAGAALATPHKKVVEFFDSRGFKTEFREGVACGFIHGLGHGVGLEIHEAPSLGGRSTGRLRAGHVVTVEPGLYDPQIGGVRFEDTVAVTTTGWRPLAVCRVPWEI
ncbi:MAG: M24 family metallopeptidase [Verrucomicrobia bacterium]|nr:MAG: M24 family metallopeptidase [Verrucomicrobiota bacterium]